MEKKTENLSINNYEKQKTTCYIFDSFFVYIFDSS